MVGRPANNKSALVNSRKSLGYARKFLVLVNGMLICLYKNKRRDYFEEKGKSRKYRRN